MVSLAQLKPQIKSFSHNPARYLSSNFNWNFCARAGTAGKRSDILVSFWLLYGTTIAFNRKWYSADGSLSLSIAARRIARSRFRHVSGSADGIGEEATSALKPVRLATLKTYTKREGQEPLGDDSFLHSPCSSCEYVFRW
jgi:hypothetical protein